MADRVPRDTSTIFKTSPRQSTLRVNEWSKVLRTKLGLEGMLETGVSVLTGKDLSVGLTTSLQVDQMRVTY